MPPERLSSARRLRLLRAARKKLERFTKPGYQRGLAATINTYDKEARRLRAEVAAGKVAKGQAKRMLALLARVRRETARVMTTTPTVAMQVLRAIDRDIKRIQGEG